MINIINPCRHYDIEPAKGCGGCTCQHLDTLSYSKLKKQRIEKALEKNHIHNIEVNDTFIMPPATRWRARFHGVKTQDGVQLGFQQAGSHHIVDMQECHVLLPSLFSLLDPLRVILAKIMTVRERMDIQVTILGQQIDLLLFVEQPLNVKRRQHLSDFAIEYKVTRIAEQVKNAIPEVIVLRGAVYKQIGDYAMPLPIGGFLQASAEAENTLSELVAKVLSKAKPKKVADLFCGIGTFSFPFAQEKYLKSIEGYDSFSPAIDAYNQGAKENNLGRLRAEKRDLFDLPLTRRELDEYDCVIIDPPRKGAFKQMQNLAQSKTPLILSISCHPDSFARDSKILIDGGYRLKSVTPVDQFLWSDHIEVVGIFTKNKKRR